MSIYNTEGFSNLVNQPSDEKKVDDTNLSHIPSYSSIYNSKRFSTGNLYPTSSSDTPQRKLSLTELKNTPEFSKRAKRFLDGIGENDNIFEYLRDSEYSLGSAMVRSFQVGKWTDEQKQDYNYLMNSFRNAKLEGFRERMGFVKDLAIDVIADPLNILSLLFIPATGGGSAALNIGARKVAADLAESGVKKYMKKGGIYGAAEGASWGGSYDYFNQSIDFGLGNNDGINWKNVAATGLIGGGIGAGIGVGLTGAGYLAKKYKFSNEDAIIKQYDEWDTDGWSASGTRKQISDAENLPTLRTDLKDTTEQKRYFLGRLLAEKPTTRFVQLASESKTLNDLLSRFRYDYDVMFFNKGHDGLRKDSYGLSLARRQGNYLFRFKKAIKQLDRTGWWAKLSQEDNDQLIAYLQNPNIKNVNGKPIKDYIAKAGDDIKGILDDTFLAGEKVGIFEKFRRVTNYFPRRFKRDAIEQNRVEFEELLFNSKHTDPINSIEQAKKVAVETGQEVDVYVKDLTVDEDVFGRTFLDPTIANPTKEAIDAAKRKKAKAIVDNMLEYKYQSFEINGQQNAGSGSASFLRHRLFTDISDEKLRPFIDNDVQNVLEDYFVNAAAIIERSDKFGQNLYQFRYRFIDKIQEELTEKGMARSDVENVSNKLEDMYLKVTGQNKESGFLGGTRISSKAGQAASEWGRLSQQMAHLPLATLSSITEPLLLISRAGLTDTPAVVKDIATALTKETIKNVNKAARAAYRVTTGKTTKGLKDVDDDTWAEIYKTGLAMEQAVLERIEGLTGEALTGSVAKTLSNAFFQANLLQQWTSAVQLASFTTGKRMIRDISKKLSDDADGVIKLGNRKKDYFMRQLNELGVDPNASIRWYKNSLNDDGAFDVAKSMNQDFYGRTYLPAANRFTKEVILNPSTAEANRPLWFSSPAGQLLVQFAGYPTVFNNTVLKRFVNEMDNPDIVAPKVLGTTMLMTSIAVAGNYIRSNGKSIENLDLNNPSDQATIALDGIQRWGGLGILDYGRRWYENARVGGGDLGVLLKTPTGPLAQDVVDMILYRKGFGEQAAANLPFYGAYDLVKFIDEDIPFGRKEVRNIGRQMDKARNRLVDRFLFGEREVYSKGGLVEGPKVPNTKEDPAEAINPATGEPYTAGTFLEEDEEERIGFSEGEIVKLNLAEKYNKPEIKNVFTPLDFKDLGFNNEEEALTLLNNDLQTKDGYNKTVKKLTNYVKTGNTVDLKTFKPSQFYTLEDIEVENKLAQVALEALDKKEYEEGIVGLNENEINLMNDVKVLSGIPQDQYYYNRKRQERLELFNSLSPEQKEEFLEMENIIKNKERNLKRMK